jgi:hypothetical protein
MTHTFPAYAVLLQVNDALVAHGYWDVHHIEPVINDAPGAALEAYSNAVDHLLAYRKQFGSADAYLAAINLIAGPDTNFGEVEEKEAKESK